MQAIFCKICSCSKLDISFPVLPLYIRSFLSLLLVSMRTGYMDATLTVDLFVKYKNKSWHAMQLCSSWIIWLDLIYRLVAVSRISNSWTRSNSMLHSFHSICTSISVLSFLCSPDSCIVKHHAASKNLFLQFQSTN